MPDYFHGIIIFGGVGGGNGLYDGNNYRDAMHCVPTNTPTTNTTIKPTHTIIPATKPNNAKIITGKKIEIIKPYL